MALIQVNFVSRTLFRTVPIQVILPVDKIGPGVPTGRAKPFKTLYLLHGVIGNYTDWVSGTRIQRWAEARDLAVVMPSGDNAFYVDNEASGNYYGQFIGEELVDITRRMFPLSRAREDTFIGGLSMGGYGAIRNGLKYHDTFSRIIALSAALHIMEPREPVAPQFAAIEQTCFGDLAEAARTDKNPRVLIERLKAEGAALPGIYMACGIDDSLLEYSRLYRDLFEENGFEVDYYEGPGAHEWDFWDQQIHRALDWLPLDDAAQGINSGNIAP